MAVEVRQEGTGVASPRFLPGVRLVRAFNAIGSARPGSTRRIARVNRSRYRSPAMTRRH